MLKNFNDIRKEKKVSLVDLADLLEVRYQTVADKINGVSDFKFGEALLIKIDSIDFNDLSGFASNHTTGFFCSNNLKNTPNGYTSGSILLVRTFEEVNKIIYTNPFNNDIYINTSLNNKWSRWRKVVSEDYDTGWIPLPLTNGASPDTYSSSYLPVSYRVITQGESKTIQIIGNIKNLSTGLVFSQLPNNIAPIKTIEYKLNQRTSSNSTLAYITNDGAMKVVGTADPNNTYMINLSYII